MDDTLANDKRAVLELDTRFQAAVAAGDHATIDQILADDFALVTGIGDVFTKADIIHEARSGRIAYREQTDMHQTVRVWGDTAVITALLKAAGTKGGEPFEYRLWFSDTYVRMTDGWRYVFGQAAQRLPDDPTS